MLKPADYYKNNSNKFGWGTDTKIPDYKINEIIPYISGKKIIDIGCGPGHLVDILSKKGFDSFGIDSVPSFIDYAKKNKKGNFQIGDANKTNFKSKEFDTVILKSVLEHLKDDQSTLKEALRIGKKIIVIVPQKTSSKLKKRGLIYSHYQDKSHLRNYSKRSLTKLINISGGKLIKLISIEPLPIKSIFFELFTAPKFLKRIIIKIFFLFFKQKKYYLELLAIIKPC
ncbi:MAG: class I SAM-dependent methyltransferase [Candidatus Shapirobacteria bacterium]|nr:class I SAM-dependent methyltransferase [Candidatus Shapirobacteria bacterium]MDD4410491.1 class I SAM-dependent methyltransferase [Candidatus Shapirobacteria bacterium]